MNANRYRRAVAWIILPWLAACTMAGDTAGEAYDGRWPVTSMTRDAECAGLVRGEFVVVEGTVSGQVTHSTEGSFTVSGRVNADGRFQDVQAGGTAVDVTVDGHLTGDAGVGTWRTRDCSGTWSARRAR